MNLDSTASEVIKEIKGKMCFSDSSFKSRLSTVIQRSSTSRNSEAEAVKEENCLYLFKTHARSKILAFRRLVGPEFPMRMLPLDNFSELSGVEHSVLTPRSAANSLMSLA